MKIELFPPLSFIQLGKRDNQEDARCPDIDQMDASQRFFVVCDGVGGASYGELASKTVCMAIQKKMKKFDLSQDFTNEMFSEVLDYAYGQLDRQAESASMDMGTTLTFLCLHGEGCTIAHIGDSRIYQLRPNIGIVYKSDDHSLVNNMVRSGMLSPEQAEDHPQGNVITRCMKPVSGMENRSLATVLRTIDVRQGDYFLLCSDGVQKCLDDDKLVELLLMNDDSNKKKMQLMAQMAHDSHDNNTAILVQVRFVENDEDSDSLQDEAGWNDPETIGNQLPTQKFSKKRQVSTEIESIQTVRKSLFRKIRDLFLV